MTTTITPRTLTLESVRELAPSISDRSAEIETARRLPADILADLVAAGCFRSLVPTTLGGDEASLVDHGEMLETLAQADGSVGWTVMIGSAAPVLLGHLPVPTVERIYADGPDVIAAGAFNPGGRAVPDVGGFRVAGQWAFASGCEHAQWFLAHCLVEDGRMPPLRMAVLPATDVEIVDTWSVMGMGGTGSHDFTVADTFVPEEYTFAVFEQAELDATVMRIPELSLSTMGFAAVAVGIAGGALGEITELAGRKVPMFAGSTLAGNPLFRYQLGEASAALRAARTLLYHDAGEAWAMALDRAPFDDAVRARFRSDMLWIANTAAAIVDVAYRAGGGSALYLRSPQQRRLRDIHTLTQHFGLKLDTFTTAGAVFAGQEVDTSFL